MWNRWQDPDTGTLVSEDPAQAGQNWYIYCGNSPLTNADRTGLDFGQDTDTLGVNGQPQTMQSNVNVSMFQGGWNARAGMMSTTGCFVVGIARMINSINNANGIDSNVTASQLVTGTDFLGKGSFVDKNGNVSTQSIHDAIMAYTGKDYTVGRFTDVESALNAVANDNTTDHVLGVTDDLAGPGGKHAVNVTQNVDPNGVVTADDTSQNGIDAGRTYTTAGPGNQITVSQLNAIFVAVPADHYQAFLQDYSFRTNQGAGFPGDDATTNTTNTTLSGTGNDGF